MTADLLLPATLIVLLSIALTAAALWAAGRLAPWFLKEAYEPRSLRSYFLDPMADMDWSRGRLVTTLIASAIILTVVLGLTVASRMLGWTG